MYKRNKERKRVYYNDFFDGDGEGVENLWGAFPDFLHIVPLGSLGSLHPSRTPVFLSAHPSSIAFHTEYYVVMAVMPTLQVSGNPHSFIYTPYPFTRRMKLLFFIGINKIREIYIKKDRNRRYNLLFFL